MERSKKVHAELCKIARKLMTMPASSAASECVFSYFSIIQTKLRNRLGIEKAANLVMCYAFLRGNLEVDW